jgi:sodium-dependent dicarboxylate transporter 2/3/5
MRAIDKKYEELGKMTVHEIQVMILFILLILLWFFKTPIFMPGWGDLFSATNSEGDRVVIAQATPAILIVLLLFILPRSYNTPCSDSGSRLTKSPALITWRLIETKMCWGVLFLLGGGFTIAKGLQTSGLSTMLVTQLNKLNLSSLPAWVASLLFTGLTVIITNLCSNTATGNILVPILADTALTMCLNPVYLTLPAAIACSYAFSLPVSTAPNAIVYGHSSMSTGTMFRAGVVMNLICFLVVSLAINTYAVPMFGLDTFPAWAALDPEIRGRCAVNSTL